MEREEWSVSEPQTIELEGVNEVRLSIIAGNVNVIGHDGPDTRIEITRTSGRPVIVTFQDGRLNVRHESFPWSDIASALDTTKWRASADISLLVPQTSVSKLSVVSATLLASTLVGDVSFSTVSGDISIDRHRGDAKVSSVSGEVAVQGHSGVLDVSTVSGNVVAAGAFSRFSVNGVSANTYIDLEMPCASAKISTVSGDAVLRLASEQQISARLETVSGRVTVNGIRIEKARGKRPAMLIGNPDALRFDLSVNSVSGNITAMMPAADSDTLLVSEVYSR